MTGALQKRSLLLKERPLTTQGMQGEAEKVLSLVLSQDLSTTSLPPLARHNPIPMRVQGVCSAAGPWLQTPNPLWFPGVVPEWLA